LTISFPGPFPCSRNVGLILTRAIADSADKPAGKSIRVTAGIAGQAGAVSLRIPQTNRVNIPAAMADKKTEMARMMIAADIWITFRPNR
jgi:hypothetical protein